MMYDSTLGAYHLLTVSQPSQALTSLAAATTTDIGGAGSHNIKLTGTAAITSFGTNSAASNPIYFVTVSGASTTLVQSATLQTPTGYDMPVAQGSFFSLIYTGSGVWTVFSYSSNVVGPNTVNYSTGSGTYTPSFGTLKIRVRIVGGGGGGGGGGAGAATGGTGGTTSYGPWTAIGGSGGAADPGGAGGAGGSGGAAGTGRTVLRLTGTRGGAGSSATMPIGGAGGGTMFGPGAPNVVAATTKTDAVAWGGGGSGATNATSGGGGGGGGEFVEFWVFSPAVRTYSVGAGGAAGAGATLGGAGQGGYVTIDEYFDF